jgi:NADH:ubiquinone oxidoreductase subunit E
LGSCALAPVLVIDGVYHNKVKLEAIPSILKEHADAAMTR